MHVIIYANPTTEPYQRLEKALDTLTLDRPPEVHDDLESFKACFRSAVACPDVLIIMPEAAATLAALVDTRELFEPVRTIIILPSRDPDLISLGHRFHPRFMAFRDDTFDTLSAVIRNLEHKVGATPSSDPLPSAAASTVGGHGRPPVNRIAAFIIDRERGTEIAIDAQHVLEATPINGVIQPLPAAVDFFEGFMHLRDEAIPVINLKKRLGLADCGYGGDAKVAVVGVDGFRFGLLLDDINDVLPVTDDMIRPVHPALLTDQALVSEIVRLDGGRRTLQLLDLTRMWGNAGNPFEGDANDLSAAMPSARTQRADRRFVVFSAGDQHYGMPVEETQEITFPADIDRTFQSDFIEGSLDLRGRYIPVVNAAHLLHQAATDWQAGADTRILVLDSGAFQYGMIVDRISDIIAIADDAIMRLPGTPSGAVDGVFQHADGRNIMLIAPSRLIDDGLSELKSVARLKASDAQTVVQAASSDTRHLITAECYLLFSIGRTFAIELNDVQEIIEAAHLMALPGSGGFDHRIINLRGTVVPVVDLRRFYDYAVGDTPGDNKLIIARNDDRIVAFEVDRILTIYKQVQFQRTPSLNPRFSGKEDTLDRLIEFVDETGIKEHVLVVNVGALIRNHLDLCNSMTNPTDQPTLKEKRHGSNPAHP